jgi:hypothetical protein
MRAVMSVGLILLASLWLLAPPAALPGAGRVVALVPPWQAGGLGRAAATGLAVVDLGLWGHALILDTGGDAAAFARLQGGGFWLLDARETAACAGYQRGQPGGSTG